MAKTGAFEIGEEYQARFKRYVSSHGIRWTTTFVGYGYLNVLCVDRSEDSVTFAIHSTMDINDTRIRTVPIEHKYPFETAYVPYESDSRKYYRPLQVSSIGWDESYQNE